MTRLVHRPIIIESWQQEWPMCFRDGDTVHQVKQIIDSWAEMGDWWNGEGERHVLRVETLDFGIYDIERAQGQWFLYRIWD